MKRMCHHFPCWLRISSKTGAQSLTLLCFMAVDPGALAGRTLAMSPSVSSSAPPLGETDCAFVGGGGRRDLADRGMCVSRQSKR